MSYLVVNEQYVQSTINEEVVNEGLKTSAHNIWTRTFIGGGHAKNTKHEFGSVIKAIRGGFAGGAAAAGAGVVAPLIGMGLAIAGDINAYAYGGIDKLDQKYFSSMFTLDKSMIKKLSNLCVKHKATAFTEDELYLKVPGANSDNAQMISPASRMTRKATRGFGNGMFSTATCYKLIPFKNNRKFVVYLTFDEDKILECKALVYKHNTADITHHYAQKDFTVVDIPEIKQISPELYKE